ncbi:MAG: spore coat U domain-containing protein, partial [Candidatus Eremiobacteraeota bacterium]|nr:spore coat U domain-containing protein [Candidatus Eremiobacteraeota bacterium]
MKLKTIGFAAASVILFYSAPSLAGSSTANLSVTATVVTTCTIATLPVPFGNYLGTNTQANGTITVVCPNGFPYTVDLGQGLNYAAGRRMTLAGNFLNYGLFSDNADTQVWGSTSGGAVVSGTGTGLAQRLTVFGLLP